MHYQCIMSVQCFVSDKKIILIMKLFVRFGIFSLILTLLYILIGEMKQIIFIKKIPSRI